MKKIFLLLSFYSISTLTCANDLYPDLSLSITQLKSLKDFKKPELGPGAPLTYLSVSSVISSTVPNGELIRQGQVKTTKHYGGSHLYVTTIELGYGSNLITRMNGYNVPISELIDVLPLCYKPGGGIEPCTNGAIAAGFRRTWNVSNYGNGEFTYQLTSINYPYDSKTTTLEIQ